MSLVVGLDLGGSTLRAVAMTTEGEVLDERIEAFNTLATDPIGRIAAMARQGVSAVDAAWSDVDVVGIGLAGSVRDTGVSMATNIPGVEGEDVAAALSRALDRPVVADNDANIAALSEWIAAGQSTISDLALITVGTGVGVGIIANGRLLRGHHGEAGEVGFLPMSAAPLVTIEDVAGGAALARAHRKADDGPERTGREVLDLVELGDAQARSISDRQASAIGWLAVAVRFILDPEVIVLSGGIGLRPGFAYEVERHARLLAGTSSITIRPSVLSEQSVALGAAHLARLTLAGSSTDDQPALPDLNGIQRSRRPQHLPARNQNPTS